jgi:hypothetical protein
MGKNGFDLLSRYAGKPFEKLIEPRAALQVFEKRLDWDANAAEDPRTADFIWFALDSRTLVPVKQGNS